MIKFPNVHIATSVQNRILNLADQLPDPSARNTASEPASDRVPAPPTTAMQSAVLDSQLMQPPADVGPVENSPDPGATLSGAPLLDTILTPGQ